ncbi:MAG TPA: SET domain-containing protein [Blastocatellia bacterium]|jgi:SET domain-containing protein
MMLFLLEVKPSAIDGQGLFTKSAIPSRSKIGELTGELITVLEARKRARARKRIKIVELNDSMALDVEEGNEFKYINHSCSPNTFMRVYRGHVEFYALRGIGIGEELTCDYGETHHEGALACRCGSPNCIGRL